MKNNSETYGNRFTISLAANLLFAVIVIAQAAYYAFATPSVLWNAIMMNTIYLACFVLLAYTSVKSMRSEPIFTPRKIVIFYIFTILLREIIFPVNVSKVVANTWEVKVSDITIYIVEKLVLVAALFLLWLLQMFCIKWKDIGFGRTLLLVVCLTELIIGLFYSYIFSSEKDSVSTICHQMEAWSRLLIPIGLFTCYNAYSKRYKNENEDKFNYEKYEEKHLDSDFDVY